MSLTQAFNALDGGNVIRLHRADLMRQIAAGEIEAVAVLRDPAWFMQSMLVSDFLLRVPRIGRTKVRMLNIRGARQWPCVNLLAPIGDLNERQREWIVEQLPTLTGRELAAAV